MAQEIDTVETIRNTIQNWVEGKVNKAEFDRFLSQANRTSTP